MDRTPHEGKMNRLHGRTAIGIVRTVNLQDRTVTCSTASIKGDPTHDLWIQKARMLGMSNHYNGAESVSMPEAGAVCVLHWVDTQAYIIGFLNAPDPELRVSNEAGFVLNREQINVGDTMFYGKEKNFVAIRNGGPIEIQASSQLKTFYLPDRGELSTFCLNYDFLCSGGTITWLTSDTEQTSKLTAIIKDQISPTKIIKFVGGNADNDAIMTLQTGTPNKYQGIDSPNFSLEVKDNGETLMNVNAKAGLNIKEGGETQYYTMANLGITVDDATAITSKKDITVHTDTNMTMTIMAKLFAEAENIVLNAKTSGKAGDAASDAMVLGDKLLILLKTMAQTFTTHSHFYMAGPSPSTTPPPMIPMMADESILSKKWKVE